MFKTEYLLNTAPLFKCANLKEISKKLHLIQEKRTTVGGHITPLSWHKDMHMTTQIKKVV